MLKHKIEWSFEKKIYFGLLPFIFIGIVASFFYDKLNALMLKYRPFCVFRYFFHIYCPGCGGTRATGALIHGHIIQSFLYHPLVPTLAIMIGTFMVSHTISLFHPQYKGVEIKTWHAILIIAIIILNFIIRNVLLYYGLPTYL